MAKSWKDKESWEKDAPLSRRDKWEPRDTWGDCGENAGNRGPRIQLVHVEDPDYEEWANYGHRMGYDSDKYISTAKPDYNQIGVEWEELKKFIKSQCKE